METPSGSATIVAPPIAMVSFLDDIDAESLMPGIVFMDAVSRIPGIAFMDAESFIPGIPFMDVEPFIPGIAFMDAESFIPGIAFMDAESMPFIGAGSLATGMVLSGIAIDPIVVGIALAAGGVAGFFDPLVFVAAVVVAVLVAGVLVAALVAAVDAALVDAGAACFGGVTGAFAGIFIPGIPAMPDMPARFTESARAAESRCCVVCLVACAAKGAIPACRIEPMATNNAARCTSRTSLVLNIALPK